MADNVMFNVGANFNLTDYSEKLADMYRAKGYTVNVVNMNETVIITFDKGTGGINMILGMGEGIKATCMLLNNTLSINFSDADCIGKIIACSIGWFLCLIPGVTGIIGIVKQSKLPKSIANDATMLATQYN